MKTGWNKNKAVLLVSTLFMAGALLWPVYKSFALPDAPGKDLFLYYCAQCHGDKANGKGPNATEDLPTAPKDFLDKKNLPALTDKQIINTITQGGPAEELSFVMPSWGNTLSEEEIDTLKGYLRQVCNCQYDPAAAERAKAEKEKEKAKQASKDED